MARAPLPSVIAAIALAALAGCGGAKADAPPELPIDLLQAMSGQTDCGAQQLVMVRQHRHDFTGDGVQDALAAVRCETGAGSPPSTVFALVAAEHGPQVAGLLLDDEAGEVVTEVSGQGPEAVVKGFAFSSTAPRCCPDLEVVHRYRWTGNGFDAGTRVATPLPAARPGDDLPQDEGDDDTGE